MPQAVGNGGHKRRVGLKKDAIVAADDFPRVRPAHNRRFAGRCSRRLKFSGHNARAFEPPVIKFDFVRHPADRSKPGAQAAAYWSRFFLNSMAKILDSGPDIGSNYLESLDALALDSADSEVALLSVGEVVVRQLARNQRDGFDDILAEIQFAAGIAYTLAGGRNRCFV